MWWLAAILLAAVATSATIIIRWRLSTQRHGHSGDADLWTSNPTAAGSRKAALPAATSGLVTADETPHKPPVATAIPEALLETASNEFRRHWGALARTAEVFLTEGGHRGIRWHRLEWGKIAVMATSSSTTGVWGFVGIEMSPDLDANEELVDAPGASQTKLASLLFHFADLSAETPLETHFDRALQASPSATSPVLEPDRFRGLSDPNQVATSHRVDPHSEDAVRGESAPQRSIPLHSEKFSTEGYRWRFAGRLLMNLGPANAAERLGYLSQGQIQLDIE
ncbi:MAG: hypothetical protein C0478_00675 [Planctomyces sp.]|nr:hypothetical protein [Planctomyces sp.]